MTVHDGANCGASERTTFRTRWGGLLVSAGCAIGIGNVWRFPYVAGQHGGGVFVAFYVLFLLMLGVPIMTMELAVGRASRRSAVAGYRVLEQPGTKWHLHGWVAMGGCFLLMSYYTTITGWMVAYFAKFAAGAFARGMTREAVDGVYAALLRSPAEMLLWTAVVIIAGFSLCSLGLQRGLERCSKGMMLVLLVLLVFLVGYALTLPGAAGGLGFVLLPDVSRVQQAGGWPRVAFAAMKQAIFSLGTGMASLEMLGSCMSRDHTLSGEALRIGLLDLFVALASAAIVFPACFSYGVAPDAGPALVFRTLPDVFVHMPGGRWWGAMFFLFMNFASFSTVLAVFENLLTFCEETFGWRRSRAIWVNGLLQLLACLPAVLGYNVLSHVRPGGLNILDAEDYIVSSFLLPAGSLVYLFFCVSRHGWGFDKYLAEVNAGQGLRMSGRWKLFLSWVLPIVLLMGFLSSLQRAG